MKYSLPTIDDVLKIWKTLATHHMFLELFKEEMVSGEGVFQLAKSSSITHAVLSFSCQLMNIINKLKAGQAIKWSDES